jgi:hypothetical protein
MVILVFGCSLCVVPGIHSRFAQRSTRDMDLVSPQPFWPLKNGLLSV